MGKRTEDEIRQKLADLEVAMQHEQAVKVAQNDIEDAVLVTDDDPITTAMSRVEEKIKGKEKAGKGSKNPLVASTGDATADMYKYGGIASLAVGFVMMLSHITVGVSWMAVGAGGLTILPLFIGLGMLIYNYKSKAAQVVTAASFALVIFSVFSHLTLGFWGLSLLDLIVLALPIVAGVVLLAKSNVRSREVRDSKLLK
jgi:hypothetical protein